MSTPTPEQIAEHKTFLAGITRAARECVLQLMEPRNRFAADHEIDALLDAAREEVRFAHRMGETDDE